MNPVSCWFYRGKREFIGSSIIGDAGERFGVLKGGHRKGR
jgi:hypothetical protein